MKSISMLFVAAFFCVTSGMMASGCFPFAEEEVTSKETVCVRLDPNGQEKEIVIKDEAGKQPAGTCVACQSYALTDEVRDSGPPTGEPISECEIVADGGAGGSSSK